MVMLPSKISNENEEEEEKAAYEVHDLQVSESFIGGDSGPKKGKKKKSARKTGAKTGTGARKLV